MGGHVLDRVVSANRWGVIFSAHLRDGPQRALGILDPALMAIPGLADAFLRAAEEARHRTDPRLVRVYGSGVERQLAWLASEWLEGHDGHCVLRRCRAGEALPLRYALSLALQATQAVQALHAVGTAHATQHGRLALDKLFLCTDGRFKLIGIGLPSIGHEAWPLPDDVDHFAALAPEQISDGVVSPASDIYTLGVLTVTLISGANPLQRRTIAQTTEAILAGESMPRGDRRHIPGSLAMRLGGALALNPQDRFPTVAELAAELSAELDMAGGAVTQAEWAACLRERFPADTGSVDGLREITLEQRSARVLQVLTAPVVAPVEPVVVAPVTAPVAVVVAPVVAPVATAPMPPATPVATAATVAPVMSAPVAPVTPTVATPVTQVAPVIAASAARTPAAPVTSAPTEEGPRVSRYVVVAAALLFLSIVGGGGMWALSLRPAQPVASTPAAAPAVVSEPTPVAAEPVVEAVPAEPVATAAPVETAAVPAEPVATAAPVETAAPVVSAPPVAAAPKAVKATKEPVKAAKPVAAATPVKPPPAATRPAPAAAPTATAPTATAPTAPTAAAKPVAIAAPTAAAKPAAIAAPSAPPATPPTASVATSFLEDLSVDVTADKVLLTGTLSGAAVRPWHYLSQDAGPDGATRYVVKLKGTANRGGVKRLPVAAPGVRGVSVQQDAAGLVLVVDCDCSDETPVQMARLADGFQLTIPTN